MRENGFVENQVKDSKKQRQKDVRTGGRGREPDLRLQDQIAQYAAAEADAEHSNWPDEPYFAFVDSLNPVLIYDTRVSRVDFIVSFFIFWE